MPSEMNYQSGKAVLGIIFLVLMATILIFLVVLKWPLQLPGSPSKAPGKEIEWIFSPLPAPAAQPLGKSSNGFVKQLNDEGLALYAQGRYETATERFQAALEESPMNPVLQKNLAYAKGGVGWQLIELGQYPEALHHFQEAVNLNEKEATFYMGLGLIHHQLREDERAIEMLRMAISQRSDYAQPYKLLGEIYYRLDDMDLAAGYLEKATELDPNDSNLRQRLDRVRQERETHGTFQFHGADHFIVKFEGHEQHDVAREIMDLLDEAYQEIGQALSAFPQTPITVILYSNQQFHDVTLSPAWSQGIFDGKIRLPIEGFSNDPNLLRKVVNHEYTHAALYNLFKGRTIPTWLNEGIALNLEGAGPTRREKLLLSRMQESHDLIPLENLHQSFTTFSDEMASLAYAQSYSATRYLINRYGMVRLKEFLLALTVESEFEVAFETHFMVTYSEFKHEWQSSIEKKINEDI